MSGYSCSARALKGRLGCHGAVGHEKFPALGRATRPSPPGAAAIGASRCGIRRCTPYLEPLVLRPVRGNVPGMSECAERAVLIITRTVEGTSTAIVQQRLVLSCTLPQGHTGSHRSEEHDESWEAVEGKVATLLRHEEGGEPSA